jgi:hypothetical protein
MICHLIGLGILQAAPSSFVIYTITETARLNRLDAKSISGTTSPVSTITPPRRIDQLLPQNVKP